jgi:hypothetical protein
MSEKYQRKYLYAKKKKVVKEKPDLRTCKVSGKRCHVEMSSAYTHLKEIADDVKHYSVYMCEHCEHWHVGNRHRNRGIYAK